MPGPLIQKQALPGWADPAQASVFDYPGQGLLRTVVGWLGLDDPQQVMGVGAAVEAGPMAGGVLDAVAARLPRFAKAIKAYHGSPHDFDKFSTSKIGTGEGAQAFGHGLYFAENEAVAQAYKPLAPREFIGGTGAVDWDNPIHVAIRAADLAGGPGPGIARLQQTVSATSASASNKGVAQKAIDFLKSGESFEPHVKPAGKMYEVGIDADPAHFLDWDKPLSQQSEKVQQALRAAGVQFGDVPLTPLSSEARAGWGELGKVEHPATMHYDPYGSELIRGAAPNSPIQGGAHLPNAEARLKAAGIPGIKYLDQGSRVAGEGSRNYVVFDDSLVDILKKYGVAAGAIGLLKYKADQQGGKVSKADLDSLHQ